MCAAHMVSPKYMNRFILIIQRSKRSRSIVHYYWAIMRAYEYNWRQLTTNTHKFAFRDIQWLPKQFFSNDFILKTIAKDWVKQPLNNSEFGGKFYTSYLRLRSWMGRNPRQTNETPSTSLFVKFSPKYPISDRFLIYTTFSAWTQLRSLEKLPRVFI